MRVELVKELQVLLRANAKSVFITGDLGFNFFEPLAKEFGPRFINAGIAEQNMVGLAGGMAYRGFETWVYSLVPFLVLRALEQIRNDVCFHHRRVRLIGNGAGYSYELHGSSHYGLEDFAALKGLPHLELFFPGMPSQVSLAIQKMQNLEGPAYLRLARLKQQRDESQFLHENKETLTRLYLEEGEVTYLVFGHVIESVISILCNNEGTSKKSDVFLLSRFPFNLESDHLVLASILRTKKVLLIESHNRLGGLGESFIPLLPRGTQFRQLAVEPNQEACSEFITFRSIQQLHNDLLKD